MTTPDTPSDPEPFAGLDLDEPLVDEETWQTAGRTFIAASDDETAAKS